MKEGTDGFISRHIGPRAGDLAAMLKDLGYRTVDDFISKVVPTTVATSKKLSLSAFPHPRTEQGMLQWLREIASQNQLWRSLLGMGYYDTVTPLPILRNILENPCWYTQYTPYQPEISQGRLEALLNFQTMVCDLTGLPVANASLLDEGTAAAEAMSLAFHHVNKDRATAARVFFVSSGCHPQSIAVLRTRAEPLGIEVRVGDLRSEAISDDCFGVLVQYPATDGQIVSEESIAEAIHSKGGLAVFATDLLALTLITPPGEWGADIVVGSAQRFGVPLGYGGPHAAFFATKDEFKRQMPGRLVGVSKDTRGNRALRLALQTREQHIRRERATSNICTAQVLLAIMAGMYAVYHGAEGLRSIASRIHTFASRFAESVRRGGRSVRHESFFDTVVVRGTLADQAKIKSRAEAARFNLRYYPEGDVGVSFDERTDVAELQRVADLFELVVVEQGASALPSSLVRSSGYLAHPVFERYRSETEFVRYVVQLQSKDLSLAHSMIPLGSCTMKLNATAEMVPVSWAEFSGLHPFAPREQAKGYAAIFEHLETALSEITGFSAVSLQPNAGSQGEYAGLLVIRAYLKSKGEEARSICLIPKSAHGTNPASAVMAGLKVVVVECDENGNVDLADLKRKVSEHKASLAALMVTYPSTHGVFEETFREIAALVHEAGGQVYLDGANLNALVGVSRPGEIGADVCHINLHKTFCIPHGGGGPGMGPIAVASHLAPFLPGHPVVKCGGSTAIGPVSSAPWGSAGILPIPWAYMAMMAGEGLAMATKVAIVNANYVAHRLESHYPVLYRGRNGYIAHECILDLRGIKKSSGVEVEDVAKRLMDYGFHAPTVSFPVAGTLMIEPTESESKEELDRFCNAMIQIRGEIQAIERGEIPLEKSPLHLAPHTAVDIADGDWTRPYSRAAAVFPTREVQERKFWPSVNRIDGVYGDRNLICTCPPLEDY